MNIEAYISEIKLQLTAGGVLALEIGDEVIADVINSSLREVQRYIDTTKIITVPYQRCIDMSKYNAYSISAVFRYTGYNGIPEQGSVTGMYDPVYMAMWATTSGVNPNNTTNWAYNFASWNTALQIKNTMSTDLSILFDQDKQLLYINPSYDVPAYITISYIPRYNNVDEITSDFWIDVIMRMSIAKTKIILGRARTRVTQSGALYTQDGEILLEEGNTELSELRAHLDENDSPIYPID